MMAHPFTFPENHHLLIATRGSVLCCSQTGATPIFRCESGDGILSAKVANDHTGLLAIADSHVVVLHDRYRRKDKSYQLKSADGEVRVLQFSSDFQTLFFTTSLNTCVQAYSIPRSRLLEPIARTHPSPPTVLACSITSALLISASPRPPQIQILDLRNRNIPLQLHPSASTAPVICAAFHPSIKFSSTFLLGFLDGTLAAYRVPNTTGWVRLRQPAEMGSFLKLHKASMGGISAAEFAPGYTCRAISVGKDGKCRLLDFEGEGKIIRTWHVSGSVTCLSIFPPAKAPLGGLSEREIEAPGTMIAVGTKSGKALIFNMLGLLVHEIQIDSCIIGVEWTRNTQHSGQFLNQKVDIPILKTNMELMHDLGDEENGDFDAGTVKRVIQKHPTDRPTSFPIHSSPPRDLFSPSLEPAPSVPHKSPLRRQETRKHHRRSTHRRPRIVTETFVTPSSSPLKAGGVNNWSPSLGSDTLMSGALMSSSPMSSPTQSFVTPPTSIFSKSPPMSATLKNGEVEMVEGDTLGSPVPRKRPKRAIVEEVGCTNTYAEEKQGHRGKKRLEEDNERLRNEVDELRREMDMLKALVMGKNKKS